MLTPADHRRLATLAAEVYRLLRQSSIKTGVVADARHLAREVADLARRVPVPGARDAEILAWIDRHLANPGEGADSRELRGAGPLSQLRAWIRGGSDG